MIFTIVKADLSDFDAHNLETRLKTSSLRIGWMQLDTWECLQVPASSLTSPDETGLIRRIEFYLPA
jgi:hypothetical protein